MHALSLDIRDFMTEQLEETLNLVWLEKWLILEPAHHYSGRGSKTHFHIVELDS